MVGAALVRGGRVLAARRRGPGPTAGRWELPGGKVEPGESHDQALVREVAEELGCRVRVRQWLAGEVPVSETLALRVAVVDLVSGEPRPHEHDRVRWLTAEELGEVDWLGPDRPFLPALAGILAR